MYNSLQEIYIEVANREEAGVHDVMEPHYAYCEHFELCFYTDRVTAWGYCHIKAQDNPPSPEDISRIKREVELGNFQSLLTKAEELGLFVPAYTRCEHFFDFYPL